MACAHRTNARKSKRTFGTVDDARVVRPVTTIIANKMQVRFDWFDVPIEETIAIVCRKKAVNLVKRDFPLVPSPKLSSFSFQILTEGYAFYRILDRKTEIVTAERSFILIHKQTRQIIVDNSICKSETRCCSGIVRTG